ncbi:MAG: amidohydrolase [Alphaproteobacteria bacterium]|nr:amidohydrolase [Alphaproteobacteria bacterium]
MNSSGRIDVHHHVIPEAFTAVMRRRGIKKVAGAELPQWTPERSIGIMDQNGIATAILSLSAPGVYFGSKSEAVKLARACNETVAAAQAKYPGRFGLFAVLPMPITDKACAEATYALDTLKADGVVLLASTDGHFLGDPRFTELMAELDRRRAIVFVHPNIHPTSTKIGLDYPGFFVEFLCDTSRATANLIFTGTLERFANIRWILSHAGGFVPYIAWRLMLAQGVPELAKNAPKGVLHYLQQLYYDTALSPSPYALSALLQLVDPSHILFGSDFPFAPDIVISLETQALADSPVLTPELRQAIDRENALKLLPAFKAR